MQEVKGRNLTIRLDRWKNRRKMAWISLLAGLAYPLLVLFTESTELGSIAVPFYIFVSSVVGAYIGFATMDDKFQNNYQGGRYDYGNYDSSQRINPVDYRDGIPREDFGER